jgi:hypothetical protein
MLSCRTRASRLRFAIRSHYGEEVARGDRRGVGPRNSCQPSWARAPAGDMSACRRIFRYSKDATKAAALPPRECGESDSTVANPAPTHRLGAPDGILHPTGFGHAPKLETARNRELCRRAQRLAEQLGLDVGEAPVVGGASDATLFVISLRPGRPSEAERTPLTSCCGLGASRAGRAARLCCSWSPPVHPPRQQFPATAMWQEADARAATRG